MHLPLVLRPLEAGRTCSLFPTLPQVAAMEKSVAHEENEHPYKRENVLNSCLSRNPPPASVNHPPPPSQNTRREPLIALLRLF